MGSPDRLLGGASPALEMEHLMLTIEDSSGRDEACRGSGTVSSVGREVSSEQHSSPDE